MKTLPGYEGFCMVYRHECYWKHKYCQIPSNTIPWWYQNSWNIPCRYMNGINKVIPTSSPPTPTSMSHQWTVSTNTGYIQWLSLVKSELKVAHAGRNRSLVVHTSKCGWAISPTLGSLHEPPTPTKLRQRALQTWARVNNIGTFIIMSLRQ